MGKLWNGSTILDPLGDRETKLLTESLQIPFFEKKENFHVLVIEYELLKCYSCDFKIKVYSVYAIYYVRISFDSGIWS